MKPFLGIVLAVLLLAAVPHRGMATGQEAHFIYINGEKWMLLANLLTKDLLHELDAALPDTDSRSVSTANWMGFRCVWSVVDNRIYLKEVEVDMYDAQNGKESVVIVPADSLRGAFKGYRCTKYGIRAKWLNDKNFRAGKGKTVFYVHLGYWRYYEEEMHFKVHNGKVKDMQLRRYKYIQKERMKEHNGRKTKWPAVRILQYRTIKKIV